jgi:hypothetical protein
MNPSKPPILPDIYRDASGIWRIRPDALDAAELPPELVGPPSPVAAGSVPTFLDQLYSYTTATELLSLLIEPELAGLPRRHTSP